jgi:FkbM family methyltransferase
MLNNTARRKQQVCLELLSGSGAVIGFADVGSGGALKAPWSLLPASHVRTFAFEPTDPARSAVPLCVSNETGPAEFFVAHDERSSSFHRPAAGFVARFGMHSMLTARTIEVERTTLDAYFEGRYESVDAIDINVEGHDFQVLQGAARVLAAGALKLLKIEFELAPAWDGQGWFSDIDALLRASGYCLAGIEIESARPANVRHCFHPGEPVWGKALYVPGPQRWKAMLERLGPDGDAVRQAVGKAVALYVVADIPGHAFDVIDLSSGFGGPQGSDAQQIKDAVTGAYRSARIEHGVRTLVDFVRRALKLKGAVSEA